jgi:peptidyl-tRNA hydrolase ICT1
MFSQCCAALRARCYYIVNRLNLKYSQLIEGIIPKAKLDVSYCKSSGPGGQHVNKVNSKVQIRFDLKNADWLDEYTKNRIFQMEKSRINKEGFFFIYSQETRCASENYDNAIAKILQIVKKAAERPKETSEEKKKIIRMHQKKFDEKRLEEKRRRKPKFKRNDDWC